VLTVPVWAFAPSLPLLWAGAFIMQFFVQGRMGRDPAHINELSPDPCGASSRLRLPMRRGGCQPDSHTQALFAAHTSYAQAMALSAATVFILGAVVAGVAPSAEEWRSGAVLHTLRQA